MDKFYKRIWNLYRIFCAFFVSSSLVCKGNFRSSIVMLLLMLIPHLCELSILIFYFHISFLVYISQTFSFSSLLLAYISFSLFLNGYKRRSVRSCRWSLSIHSISLPAQHVHIIKLHEFCNLISFSVRTFLLFVLRSRCFGFVLLFFSVSHFFLLAFGFSLRFFYFCIRRYIFGNCFEQFSKYYKIALTLHCFTCVAPSVPILGFVHLCIFLYEFDKLIADFSEFIFPFSNSFFSRFWSPPAAARCNCIHIFIFNDKCTGTHTDMR